MSKLADIAEGIRAIKRIDLPLVNVPCSLLPDIPELMEQRKKDAEASASHGAPVVPATVQVGLRVLTGEENLLIERLSNKMAESNGCKAFEESDAIFNMAKSLCTIAIACVDPDSDPKDPDPFFGARGKSPADTVDNCVKAILVSPHIGRDGIIYLAEQQELWQDLCNPAALKMSPERMWALVGEVAASADTYLKLRPGMRLSFARFMAVLLLTGYSQDKSLFGPTYPESSKDDPASAPS